MISKAFIQASIALVILASSLTPSVNAAAIAPGPARFARKTDKSVTFSRSAPITYRQDPQSSDSTDSSAEDLLIKISNDESNCFVDPEACVTLESDEAEAEALLGNNTTNGTK